MTFNNNLLQSKWLNRDDILLRLKPCSPDISDSVEQVVDIVLESLAVQEIPDKSEIYDDLITACEAIEAERVAGVQEPRTETEPLDVSQVRERIDMEF